jgi:hypothetical protein
MDKQSHFCARFDIDTIFTPWRIANWVSLFGEAVLAKHDPDMEFLPTVAEHARREGVELADLRTIFSQWSA